MFWLSYECFSVLCNAFLLKSVISSHNSCGQESPSVVKFMVINLTWKKTLKIVECCPFDGSLHL